MKTTLLKKRIIEKFGSINSFANHRKQELNSWTIIRALDGTIKKDQEELLKVIKDGLQVLNPEKEIKTDTREFIRRTILTEFSSFAEFNRQFPEFSKSFLSNLINGKKKILDKRSRRLLNVCFNLYAKNPAK